MADEIVVFEENKKLDWGDGVTIDNNYFSSINQDFSLEIAYTMHDEWGILELIYGDWSRKVPYYIDGKSFDGWFSPSPYYETNTNGKSLVTSFSFSESSFQDLKEKGLIIHGSGVEVTKVCINGTEVEKTLIGNPDKTTDFFSAFSRYYRLKKDQTLKLEFDNFSNKEANWNNWLVAVTNDKNRFEENYNEFFVLRADAYGWGPDGNSEESERYKITHNFNWNTFLNDMDGAHVVLTVSRYNSDVTIYADVTASDNRTKYSEQITIKDCCEENETIRAFLTTERGYIELDNTKTSITDFIKPIEGGDIEINNIKYNIKSESEKTLVVVANNYKNHVVIPESVTIEGKQYKVVGIESNAFTGCEDLITISLPNTLLQNDVGKSLFSVCKNLAAIIWEPLFPMTDVMLGGVTNPNLLFYTKSEGYAPASVNNVVVNGTANNITLSDAGDGNNFYCPTEFTALNISYTHNYNMTSGFDGNKQGWETIALPFDVQEIKHSSKGAIAPFASWNNSTTTKPFWLYQFNTNGFTRAAEIKANTPYIISMPNNEKYDRAYILSGTVSFSSTNVPVKESSSVNSGRSGNKTFIPAFCKRKRNNGIYVLNVKNNQHSETGGHTEGSTFVNNLRSVSPFEAYITDGSAGTRGFIDINFDNTTGIENLEDYDNNVEKLSPIFTLSGKKVGINSQQDINLPQGIYIKKGKKIIVR